ncbi:MAG: hypothetical protein SNJ59_09925 [Aggregatilineales bacterium]
MKRPLFPFALLIVSVALLAGCNFRLGMPHPSSEPAATADVPAPQLVVAFVDRGHLYVWRLGDGAPHRAAERVTSLPYLSPDGRQVAFTRGQESRAQTLWLVELERDAQRQLTAIGELPTRPGASAAIAQIGWLDAETLYFNTEQVYAWGTLPDHNLYRIDVGSPTRAARPSPSLILPPGAGGAFTPSPDGRWLITINPGAYDTAQGIVHLLDPRGEIVRIAHRFTAVTTAAEAPFYPPVEWLPDSSGARVTIPDRRALTEPAAAPPAAVWLIPVSGEARIVGIGPVGPHGLPVWSQRSGAMLYSLPSVGGHDLMRAEADGSHSALAAAGLGAVYAWLPNSDRFVFGAGAGAPLMLDREDRAAPQVIAERAARFHLAERWIVYAEDERAPADLRYVDTVTGEQGLIARLTSGPPAFDAVVPLVHGSED